MEISERKVMKKRELAEFANVSVRMVDTWVAKRAIPFIKIGRAVRFDIVDVLEFLASKKVR